MREVPCVPPIPAITLSPKLRGVKSGSTLSPALVGRNSPRLARRVNGSAQTPLQLSPSTLPTDSAQRAGSYGGEKSQLTAENTCGNFAARRGRRGAQRGNRCYIQHRRRSSLPGTPSLGRQ